MKITINGKEQELDFADEGFQFSNYGRSLADYPYDTRRLKGVITRLTNTLPCFRA
jgi:isoquinoline 1-oxidoreductase beta subunit